MLVNGPVKVEKALTTGADVHFHGELALLVAAAHGYVEIVRIPMAVGADIHADDDAASRQAATLAMSKPFASPD